MSKAPLKFFSGRASTYLSKKIVSSYGTTLGKSAVLMFSDGEFQPSYEESVRGCSVFIIQSTFPPTENLFEPKEVTVRQTPFVLILSPIFTS